MLNVRIKVRLRLFDARCPSCDGTNLRPGVIRPWVENVFLRTWLMLSLRRPYLCRDCDARFYDFRLKSRRMTTEDPELEMLKECLSATVMAPLTEQTTEADDKEGKTA
jgi:hypothetical protein